MEDTHVHVLDYLNVFRRRKWWLIVPIATSIVVGALLVKVLPKEYKSTATLAVSAPAVSPSLVNDPTPFDNQERMRALSQQLVSPTILARVVREEGIGGGKPDEKVLNKLRHSIAISVPEPVFNTNEVRRLDSFYVSYSTGEANEAQRITNRLINVFVEENSKARSERAADTSEFIASQLQASQKRLAELESQLRTAKESHMGQLPEQTQANLQTLTGLRQQMEANATSLRGEQDRLSMIERQIDGIKRGSTDVLVVPGTSSQPNQPPETRVVTLERDLAAARAMYTDKHPEVQRLMDELKTARADAAAERQKPESERNAALQIDPSYRQLASDREMGRLRIRDLQRADEDVRRQIAMYQGRVESAPRVEQQLASVQRDYDLEKQQYSELANKLHTATIAENLEKNKSGEQFTVLYSASYPTEPVSPIPWRVMLISIVAGICLGGAATFAREYLDRSVHDVRELKDEFDLPVLGEIVRIQPV